MDSMKKLLFAPLVALIVCASCTVQVNNDDNDKPLFDYDVEARVTELGIELSEPAKPVANYVNSVRTGNLVFMAGKGATKTEGGDITRKGGGVPAIENGH